MASLDPYLLQAFTLLDAVNLCLRTIGSANVLALDDASLTPDSEAALKTVHDVSIITQSEGWMWNTEMNLVLPVASDGTVTLPANTLKVNSVSRRTGLNLVQRGNRIYDPYQSTFAIGCPVHAKLVVALDYEDVPQAARCYIAMTAARTFASGRMNNQITNQFTELQYEQATARLYEAEDEDNNGSWDEMNLYLLRRHRGRRFTA